MKYITLLKNTTLFGLIGLTALCYSKSKCYGKSIWCVRHLLRNSQEAHEHGVSHKLRQHHRSNNIELNNDKNMGCIKLKKEEIVDEMQK